MRAAIASEDDCPRELDALARLLERQNITCSEFTTARTYFEMSHAERAEVDSQMTEVNRAIVANLVLRQMTPGGAVYAATACHPGGILRCIREALDQLGTMLGASAK
jgi:hypothetical protein